VNVVIQTATQTQKMVRASPHEISPTLAGLLVIVGVTVINDE